MKISSKYPVQDPLLVFIEGLFFHLGQITITKVNSGTSRSPCLITIHGKILFQEYLSRDIWKQLTK